MLNPNFGALKTEFLKYGGSYYNFPEHNCCGCGMEDAPVTAVLPGTSVGCSHIEANKQSRPMIEYCNVEGLSRSECEE